MAYLVSNGLRETESECVVYSSLAGREGGGGREIVYTVPLPLLQSIH